MRFHDQPVPDYAVEVHRARSVRALLPGQGWVRTGTELWSPRWSVGFHADLGVIVWGDRDGENRVLELPEGITAESVAAILSGLAALDLAEA